jgi:DNA-binding transcriptional MerR regulator
MKISELSERSGVPLPTIKFYIREGLLPAGQHSAKNQADYSSSHLARLALIRALKDDAGLAIGVIARALRAADTAAQSGKHFVAAAIDSVQRTAGDEVSTRSSEFVRARADVRAAAAELAWEIDESSTALHDAARALAVIRRSFPHVEPAPYAEAARSIAEREIPEDWNPGVAPDETLHYAVLGTVLGEPLLLALRRMAHIARSRQIEQKAQTPQSRAARSKDAPADEPVPARPRAKGKRARR